MRAGNTAFPALARSTPFAAFRRLGVDDGNGNRIAWWGRFDRLQRHVIAELLQTLDELSRDLRLVLLIVVIRSEFVENAAIANDVEDNRNQLVSHRHDGFLLSATAPHSTIQRRQMRILLVSRRPRRLT